MEKISPTSFWSVMSIVAASIGGIFLIAVTHAGAPRHPGAASAEDVSDLEIRSERVAVNVEHNSRILNEVKGDLKELRVEQSAANLDILRAIEGIRDGR